MSIQANTLSDDVDARVLLSQDTRSLVLYRESCETVHIDLSGMPRAQPVIAVDTKKSYSEIHLGRLEPGPHALKLPAVSDWIFAVGRFRTAHDPGTLDDR